MLNNPQIPMNQSYKYLLQVSMLMFMLISNTSMLVKHKMYRYQQKQIYLLSFNYCTKAFLKK